MTIWGIGLEDAYLDHFRALGDDVVATDAPDPARLPEGLVLVVVSAARVPEVRATEVLARTPIAALAGDDSAAAKALADGADWTITPASTRSLAGAIHAAARRLSKERAPRQGEPPFDARGVRDPDVQHATSSEQRYRTIVENAGDAILVVDYESALCLEANPAACSMFGYTREEFRRLTGRMLAGPDGDAVVTRLADQLRAEGRGSAPRHPFRRRDGSTFIGAVQLTTYEFKGKKKYIATIRDVSEQVEREDDLARTNRQLEESQRRLLHSSRLAALGHLAAGVAHEINNPLQFIVSGLEEIEPLLAGAPAAARLAHADMREGLERIRLVSRSLLPFAKVEPSQAGLVDLCEVVQWACRVTSTPLRHRARLDLRLAPVPPIHAHRTQVGQLVTNLLTNAADSIEEGFAESNRITVTTSFVDDRVRLRVEDTGCGVPEELRDRIFEPYFTTKSRDVGTGLGLPLCQEIVTRSGGSIGFDSEVGKGTSFLVTFPPAADATVAAPAPQPATLAGTSGRRVLLIDDEEPLLRALRKALADYDVVTATGGADAIARLDADDRFDAIVCDLMMPDFDGPRVYTSVQRAHPGLETKIIFCTGGAFTDRVRTFLRGVPNAVIDKPVSPRDLCEAIERVCSRRP